MAFTKQDNLWAHHIRNELFLFDANPDFTVCDFDDLIKLLSIADDAYYNESAPILHDEEYDAIRLFCETANPNHTYFLGIGSQVRGGKVKLPYTMGSLTQVYAGDTQKWISQYNLQDADIVITEKLDGCSALIVYGQDGKLQIAYSRGDGIEGADITRHVSKIVNVPKQVSGPMVVRAEIIFSKEDWNEVKTKITRSGGAAYKNARNCVAGLMNASESDPVAYEYLSVVAYEIVGQDMNKEIQIDTLNGNGFDTPNCLYIKGKEATDEYLTKALTAMREFTNFEIDGIVLDVSDVKQRAKMKSSGLNPEYSRKFKIADSSNYAETEVVEIELNISKNGYLKPTIKIQPVELVGVTVSKCTGFNMKFIYDNKIQPGCKIRVTRSGDVIPFCLGVAEAGPLT
jgi:DNA ligase (NAD+)